MLKPIADVYTAQYFIWQSFPDGNRECRTFKRAATAFPGVQPRDYLNGFDEEGEDYYNILGVVRLFCGCKCSNTD